MSRLRANLIETAGAGNWLRWLLLVIGTVMVIDVAWSIHQVRADLSAVEKRNVSDRSSAMRRTHADESEKQVAAAEAVVKRLSFPWSALLTELEKARTEKVGLLSVEPDAESRSLAIAGETKDLVAVTDYVATLEESDRLNNVYLARHEIKQGSARSVAFQVKAEWK